MIEAGKTVRAHYKGTLDDGTEFDNSYNRDEPLEFTVGVGQMIPGFDAAVQTMNVGERKTVTIPAAEAYGEYRSEMVETVPVEYIPNAEDLPVGEYIFMPLENGQTVSCKVVSMEDGKVTFDFNHELAGQNLTFLIELIAVLN